MKPFEAHFIMELFRPFLRLLKSPVVSSFHNGRVHENGGKMNSTDLSSSYQLES